MHRKIEIDITTLPVMKACCKTCPFKPDERGVWRDTGLASKVIARNLFTSHQICHGTEGENREPNNRCKGYNDYATTIYRRLGIDESLLK